MAPVEAAVEWPDFAENGLVRSAVKAALLLAWTVAGLAACPIASALDVKTYLRGKNAPEQRQFLYHKVHLRNVVQDLDLENARREAAGQPLLYCQPSSLRLTPEAILKIVDDEINLPSTKPENATEVLMLRGLKKKFPCK